MIQLSILCVLKDINFISKLLFSTEYRKAVHPSLSLAFISAPLSMSILTISSSPTTNILQFNYSMEIACAVPKLLNSLRKSTLPREAARWIGLIPLSSLAFISTPFSMSMSTMFALSREKIFNNFKFDNGIDYFCSEILEFFLLIITIHYSNGERRKSVLVFIINIGSFFNEQVHNVCIP